MLFLTSFPHGGKKVAFVSSANTSGGAGTTTAATIPGGGTTLIMGVSHYYASLTVPSGWTLVTSKLQGVYSYLTILERSRDGSEGSTVNVTGNNYAPSVMIVAVDGVSAVASATGGSGSTTAECPSITPTGPGITIRFAAHYTMVGGGASYSWPAGQTALPSATGSNQGLGTAWAEHDATIPTVTVTAAASSDHATATIALTYIDVNPPPSGGTHTNTVSYTGKANTTAGSVPAFDTGGITPSVVTSGTGAELRVASGFLTFAPTAAGTAAGYLTGDAGSTVVGIGASWKITPRTTGGESICLAITSSKLTALAAPYPNASVHLVIGRTFWEMKSITGGSGVTFTTLGSGNLSATLAADDTTIHSVGVTVAGTTATITLPDGSTQTVTHADIGSKSGPGFWVEPYCSAGNTDGLVRIQSIWVDE